VRRLIAAFWLFVYLSDRGGNCPQKNVLAAFSTGVKKAAMNRRTPNAQ
jgi:hypothetical protein